MGLLCSSMQYAASRRARASTQAGLLHLLVPTEDNIIPDWQSDVRLSVRSKLQVWLSCLWISQAINNCFPSSWNSWFLSPPISHRTLSHASDSLGPTVVLTKNVLLKGIMSVGEMTDSDEDHTILKIHPHFMLQWILMFAWWQVQINFWSMQSEMTAGWREVAASLNGILNALLLPPTHPGHFMARPAMTVSLLQFQLQFLPLMCYFNYLKVYQFLIQTFF